MLQKNKKNYRIFSGDDDDEVEYEIDGEVVGGLANVAPTVATIFGIEPYASWEESIIK